MVEEMEERSLSREFRLGFRFRGVFHVKQCGIKP